MCWPVCSAFLLVLCILFIAVLTFLLVQLKNEVYQLQSNLHDGELDNIHIDIVVLYSRFGVH